MRERSPKSRAVRRVAPEVVASVVLHVLIVGGLFLLPGLADRPPDRTQRSHVHEVAPAEEHLDPLLPPPEAKPPEPEPLPEYRLDEEPPLEEAPVFTEDDPDFDDLDDATPPMNVPHSVNPRPGPPTIGVGGGAASGPVAPVRPPALRPKPKPSKPKPTKKVSPTYPRRAVQRELEGRVLLLIEVLPDGSVGEITVKESSGHEVLDEAAVEAVKEWHFRPAYVQGQPVRSYVEQAVSFELE